MNYTDEISERTKFTCEDLEDPKHGHIRKTGELYRGKTKIIYSTNDPDIVIQHFTDNATAFNGEKKGIIKDKGVYNNQISSIIFSHLNENNIQNHFISKLDSREMLIYKADIYPIEVVIRNIVAGSLSKRLDILEGQPLTDPIMEYYLKNDNLGDPLVNNDHLIKLKFIRTTQLQRITELSWYINFVLTKFFKEKGILLVDIKLEFGFEQNRKFIVLADEISPDTCRLWDIKTNEKLDKDRFRRDLGSVEEAYMKIRDVITCEHSM